MKIGLVGLPGCGKSTVFGALTGQSVEVGFASSGKAHLGAVKVPDPRIDSLADLYSPKKKTYAEVAFTDLGRGASTDKIDRSVLNQMRESDALCQVVRGFTDAGGKAANPMLEIVELEAETILADLEIVEKRIDKLSRDRSDPRELELLQRLATALESEKPLRGVELSEDELKIISGYRFLSLKPLLLVLNVPEEEATREPSAEIKAASDGRGLGLIALSAAVEMDIAQMEDDDQREFLDSLGLDEPAKNRFIRAAFDLLDLISMLTAGPDECRAWPVRRDSKAPRAAGKIHSDIERGFIRAEVIAFADLIELRSEAACRSAGKLRVEGKDYVIADGDVVNFRFNV